MHVHVSLTSNPSSMQDVCHTKAVFEGKLKGAQCYETLKSKVFSMGFVLKNPGGGGVFDISLGGEVRPGPSYPDPVKTKIVNFPTVRRENPKINW